MASLETKTIELRLLKSQFPALPNPAVARSCLYIKSPYSKDLVEDIKVLDWRQRNFDRDTNTWLVVEDDPNQQPNEPTNLIYIRSACAKAAEASGWQFLDYTEKSEEELETQVTQAQENNLEAHVAAVCAILPTMPAHNLKIVSWGREVIKLQLRAYVDTNLWQQLKDACTKTWKPSMLLLGAGQRFDFGFVFEMAADPRIIKALMTHGKIGNLKACDLRLKNVFDDGIAHFTGDFGAPWMGIPLDQADLSEINWGSQPWEVAEVDGVIYWVADVESFVWSWLDESPYFVVYRAVMSKQQSTLEKAIKQNHLEDWYRLFGRTLLQEVEFKRSRSIAAFRPECWEHPSDPLVKHIRRFNSLELVHMMGMNETEFNWRVDEINNIRESLADEAKVEARENAIDAVVLQLQSEPKDYLIHLAVDRAKRYWTKERIARSFVTQEYAEKKLGI